MRDKKHYRYNMRTHFSQKLWDRWLARLNATDLTPNDLHLAAGITQFRKLCAAREKETL